MATKLSSKTQDKAEKLINQYAARLREINSIDIIEISLEEIEELCNGFELELNTVDSKKSSILSVETRSSIQHQYQMIIQRYRNTVMKVQPFNTLLTELTRLRPPMYKCQESTFEGQISTAKQELEDLKSNKTIDYQFKRNLVLKIERELQRLDKEFIDLLLPKLPQEIISSLKKLYQRNAEQCRDILKCYELIPELTKMRAPVNKNQKAIFDKQISTTRHKLEELQSNETFDSYPKQDLILRYEAELQRVDKEVTDQFLNVEVRDSIDLIEKTLAEPHLYSLPHLIMWRNTAQEKIQKVKIFETIPQEIVTETIEKYESLIKQLRAEILKLRTYPIPEPWCSHCMRKELTYLMKGEFIFFVHPGIEEDMRPLKLSDRDILPGGLARHEYDSRMNRMKREPTVATEELKARSARDMERKLEWFENSFAGVEKDVNFAFTELPLLYRDGRSLEYLVDKNRDDEFLQEIHDTLLRRIRHFYNNRINIPSVVMDYNRPMLVAPPKAERNIPIASGVDRGATEGLQLVIPSSVFVYTNTVFVADKYGHSISYYRDRDLEAIGSYHHTTADTPISITVFKDSLFACYSNELVKFSFLLDNNFKVAKLEIETSIEIPQICCITSSSTLFVGTLKPSLIHIYKDTFRIEPEYSLDPIRYHNNKKKRYTWLQDIKVVWNSIFCLFTGSPSPLQVFSLTGVLLRSLLTEEEVVGAYHFNVFRNPVITEWRIYIADFWDSAIKVFDFEGQFIESFSEKGNRLGQIFQPTGIFVEESGFIIVCDMKEDNCLQRL